MCFTKQQLNYTMQSGKVPTAVVDNLKLSRLHIGHTKLTCGHLMTRNNQQPTCKKWHVETRQ